MPKEETNQETEPVKSKTPMYALAGALVVVLGLGGFMMMGGDAAPPAIELEKSPAEYVVSSKMYQLKDGSYLKLGFSIVVDADKLEKVKGVLENDAPGRLPAALNMILGAKAREDLISGTHKREAFSKLLKKMLDERVFSDYNRKQTSSSDMVEIREVLVSEFVTQGG